MKAAVVPALGAPLEIRDIPTPRPGPGQVLVRMITCGVCHTDIHAANGDWPVKPHAPFIPGHEGVGIVERLGEGCTLRQLGDRVAIAWLGSACGHCSYCVSGWETLCAEQENSGYSIDGAYAEYAVADERYVVPVPDGVSAVDAAVLTCAGVTTFKAVKVARVEPAEKVAVFGIGGLGHLAIQYARLRGAEIIAVDITEDKLEVAEEAGADRLVNAATQDTVATIEALGGADVAIVLAASPNAFDQAFRSLRRGGRLICVGLPGDGALTIPIFDLVLKGITVRGSIVGTRQDLVEVFELHAEGRTKVLAESRELEEINEIFADVLAGRVPARVVLEF
jgi:alcohol dehydrogenase, propanol-preferring